MARASTAAEGRPAPAHRAAVIGDPIAHSLSPLLHRAAYEGLGLADWSYEALQVAPGELAALVGSLRAGWDGRPLDLTEPPDAELLAQVAAGGTRSGGGRATS